MGLSFGVYTKSKAKLRPEREMCRNRRGAERALRTLHLLAICDDLKLTYFGSTHIC